MRNETDTKHAGVVLAHTTIAALRRHPEFKAGKAGNAAAALAVVRDLVKQDRIQALSQACPEAVICPVLATEQAGVNMLPLAFAKYSASLGGLGVETGILQVNRTCHTGAKAI